MPLTIKGPLSHFGESITIFGCGAMAGAMLSRWIDCGLPPAQVTAISPSGRAAPGGVATLTTADGMSAPDILLIGFKPQQFVRAVAAAEPLAGPNTLVVSILAGVPLGDLVRAFPRAEAVARVMPNMPVATGRGVVATHGVPEGGAGERLQKLLDTLGHVQPIADENGFEAVTALTGCGPAFLYRFAQALTGAATRLGIDPADADPLARAMLAGAAATLAESDDSPLALAEAVASPGGMTQAGLDVLDNDGRLIALMAETLRAARERGRTLAQAARDG